MNLEFGILWIEDSFNEEEKSSLERRIIAAGFIPSVEDIPNGTDLEAKAKKQSLNHCYDLILLDYKLKDELGDALAPRIRSSFPSTTILFYSGSQTETELRARIAESMVDGVYCCNRDGFIERAGMLIDQTAQSLNRLSGMRGLAMSVVAECDSLMRRGVKFMNDRNATCLAKLTDLDENVLESLNENLEKYNNSVTGSLEDRLRTRAIDSAKLYSHFRRLTKFVAANGSEYGLDNDRVDRLRELRKRNSDYDPKVLKPRNILGHAEEVKEQDGWRLDGSEDITIDSFPDIRKAFALHLDAIREIVEIVCAMDSQ